MKKRSLILTILVLLIIGITGCNDEKSDEIRLSSPKVERSNSFLEVGILRNDSLIQSLSDQTLIEAIFRKNYPYTSEDLLILKSPYTTYQPFQIDVENHEGTRYFLTALGEDKVTKIKMFLRIALRQEGARLLIDPNAKNETHIHTCADRFASPDQICDFRFTPKGYFKGCDCGCDVRVFNRR